MTANSQLILHTGPEGGKVIPLEGNDLIIGRDSICELVINDAEVSRKHARISWQANTPYLEDLGSTNGSFVNGKRISSPVKLRDGDVISLGENISLSFESLTKPEVTRLSAASEASQNPAIAKEGDTSPSQPNPSASIQPVEPKPVRSERGKRQTMLILVLVILLCLCGLVGFFVFRYLYNAPPEFWCNWLPFIFKPELYPQCIP